MTQILEFPVERARDVRVMAYPSAEGTIRIVALDALERWLGEFSCRVADFDENAIEMLQAFAARVSA